MEIAAFGLFAFLVGCLGVACRQRDKAEMRHQITISMLNGACNARATAEQARAAIPRAKRSGLI